MGLESIRIRIWSIYANMANIKARDTGLFGKLPPDLQRAGKDIFQQGRTVLTQ